MTLTEQIAALPPWADEISLGGCEEDRNYVDLQAALARLELTRRALQAMVDRVSCDLQDECCCHEGYASRGLIDPTCRYHDEAESRAALADARRVLEVTAP